MLPLKIRNSPFHRIGDSYGHLFNSDHFMGRDAFEDTWMTRPLANVIKGEEEYRIQLTMPGFNRDEIKIEIDKGLLKVSADKHEKPAGEFIHKELPKKLFERVFDIPESVDEDHIHANLDRGILTVYLPEKAGTQHISKTVMIE